MNQALQIPASLTQQALAPNRAPAVKPVPKLLPLWGYDVDLNGIRHSGVHRAATPGDVAEVLAMELQDGELNGSGEIYNSVVITICRSRVEG